MLYNGFISLFWHLLILLLVPALTTAENCRWATMQTQGENRRTTRKIYWEGQEYCAKSFAKQFHLPYYYVCAFHKRGITPQRIIEILSVKPTASELKKKIYEIDSQLL